MTQPVWVQAPMKTPFKSRRSPQSTGFTVAVRGRTSDIIFRPSLQLDRVTTILSPMFRTPTAAIWSLRLRLQDMDSSPIGFPEQTRGQSKATLTSMTRRKTSLESSKIAPYQVLGPVHTCRARSSSLLVDRKVFNSLAPVSQDLHLPLVAQTLVQASTRLTQALPSKARLSQQAQHLSKDLSEANFFISTMHLPAQPTTSTWDSSKRFL